MKFADRPIGFRRYTKPLEVEPLYSRAYSRSRNEIDFSFTYAKGKEERKISISLTKEEALSVKDQIEEFLNDLWKENL